MSAAPQATSRTIRASTWLYSQLLVAYPQPFRRRFGPQMTQVFRDCCREATASGGIPGMLRLLRFWLIASGDLVVSALAERRREEIQMTHTRWIWLGSLAAIIGGAVAAVLAATGLTVAIAQLLDENSSIGLTLFPVRIVSWGAPALVIFYVLALIGTQARGADRAGVIGWISITVAVMGLVITALGNGLVSVVMYSQFGSCYSPLNCNFYDPDRYLMMGSIGGMLGTIIFALGMLDYGAVAIRRHILPRRNWLVLAIGVIMLLNIAATIVAILMSAGTDYAGMQKLEILVGVWPLALSILWILLGVALRPRREEAPLAETVPTQPVQPAQPTQPAQPVQPTI